MEKEVLSLKKAFQEDLTSVKRSKDIEDLKVKYLGKKGPVQGLMVNLRSVEPEKRPQVGKIINELKIEISDLCEQALTSFSQAEESKQLEEEKIDISLPGKRQYLGRHHPIRIMLREVIDILSGMGFSVQCGPEIDSDWYNFEGLNYPDDHPARDMQDTFYINKHSLLRSQTSNVQLRAMEGHNPPIRIIAPGTVFRNENISARSHVFFHQVEGIYIDEDVSFADLFATMEEFWSKLFKKDIEARFRPSYFPFVEPGIEVDLRCTACNGEGCRLCKQTGWLEVCGAGMVHPEVLKNGGIDPHKYSGYAWGLGIERLAMLRYGISDIRMFTENDMRLLAQF
ncbi:MAG: phenylalanine--tRNA ligase subunit alpha [Simkaniaceae bacterium]|nr:phenylalanine--tRNA ligase subunit alpha [Candidatus Sacchlamyda saccharinae]